MMINFMVICLQPNCRDYRAQVNYLLNMKLTICLNSCVRIKKINKQMSKVLQEIIFKSSADPIDTHSGKQSCVSSTVSTTIVSTTGNSVKTIFVYQLFSNTTRKQCEPKPNFYKHA